MQEHRRWSSAAFRDQEETIVRNGTLESGCGPGTIVVQPL
jgi:hypothetical protein